MPDTELSRPDRERLVNALEELAAPFEPDQISKLPKGTCRDCADASKRTCQNHQWISCDVCHGRHSSASIHLDYVGHADVTRRLLEVDPTWNWEPVATDQFGQPLIAGGMWIRLTVAGMTRLGFGDAGNKTGPNATKEIIGDAIRNAAMRFGVALDMWSKSDAAQTRREADQGADPEQTARASAQRYADQAARVQKLDGIQALWNAAEAAGVLDYDVRQTGSTVDRPLRELLTELGDAIVAFDRQQSPRGAGVEAPPADADGDTAPAPGPRMASQGQHRMLNAIFNNCGVKDRNDRHAYLTALLDRPVETSKSITAAEMKGLLDLLAGVTTATELDAIVGQAAARAREGDQT